MTLAFALIGLTSIVSQVILLRELLVVFYGNELSVGIILAAWLVWVAAGSWGFGKFVIRNSKFVVRSERGSFFALLQAATLFILPLELFLVRNIRNFAGTLPGEVIGFFPMVWWSFLTLAPLCLLLGGQFTAACQVAETRWSAGKIYFYESIGSVGGGLLASFLLLYYFDAWQMALGLGVLNLFCALMQMTRRWILPAATFLLAALALPTAATFLQATTLRQRWQGYDLVENRDSIYGNLVVTARGNQYTFFENGLLFATTEDFLVAEETAHYPLLQHPQPKRVLLIGGGINGTVREILKHPVEHVDYVELDPTVIAIAKRYLAPSDRRALEDPRVTIHHIDGRLFVQQQRMQGAQYDVVIANVPHPFTAQVNRLYTLEFFQEVRALLRDDAVFSLTLISAENYPSKEMQALDASVYRTLGAVFGDVLVLPGDDALLLASPVGAGGPRPYLSTDTSMLLTRWNERRLETAILTPSHLELRLTPERIAYARQVFDRAAPLNRDFEPISLYFDLVLWGGYFSPELRDAMNGALLLRTPWSLTLLAVLVLAVSLYLRVRSRAPSTAVAWSLATLGFAGMVWEVMLLFAFQALYGYVYHQIALMMTAVMAGLALGSAWANDVKADFRRWLLVVQASAIVYALLLPLALWLLQIPGAGTVGPFVLPLLITISGVLVGLAFPLATSIMRREGDVARTAGRLYAADLAGAAVGALLAGAVLIPILGIVQSSLVVALVNIFGFVVASVHLKGRKR